MLILGIRTLLGPRGGCRYPISCTNYAIDQIQTQPLGPALWRIIRRLLTCHPLSRRCHRNFAA